MNTTVHDRYWCIWWSCMPMMLYMCTYFWWSELGCFMPRVFITVVLMHFRCITLCLSYHFQEIDKERELYGMVNQWHWLLSLWKFEFFILFIRKWQKLQNTALIVYLLLVFFSFLASFSDDFVLLLRNFPLSERNYAMTIDSVQEFYVICTFTCVGLQVSQRSTNLEVEQKMFMLHSICLMFVCLSWHSLRNRLA